MTIVILILILVFGVFGAKSDSPTVQSRPIEVATVTVATPEPMPDSGLGPDAMACYGQGQGVQIESDGVTGTIVPEVMAWQWSTEIGEVDAYFTPSVDEVMALEATLAAEETGIEEHHRQYVGYVDGGERKILVDAAISTAPADAPDGVTCAEVQPVSVVTADGGESFFEAVYNLDSGEMERFSFHGEA